MYKRQAKNHTDDFVSWQHHHPLKDDEDIGDILMCNRAHRIMIGDLPGEQKTAFKVDRAVLAHTKLTTEVGSFPYPQPPEPPPPAPRPGWGSLGQSSTPAGKAATPHQSNRRKIFRPSKKAIPKQEGQSNILSFFQNMGQPAEE